MSERFMFLSHDGAGLPCAYRVHEEGHDVLVYLHEVKQRRQYDGLLKKVTEWKSALTTDTIIVFDSVGFGLHENEKPQTEEEWNEYTSIGDELRQDGYRVVGGSTLADRMELDRAWGAKLASEAGLLVPKTTRFEDWSKAIEFVKQTKQRYILKPHGNQATFDLYPSESWSDMVEYLEDMLERGEVAQMELQEFVEGIQLSCEGWWTGQEFVSLNHTSEHKPHYSTDVGAFTGETGSLIYWTPPGQSDQQAQATVFKLTEMLRRKGYTPGPLDVNCIVNESGSHFLEFTCYSDDTECLTSAGWKLIRDVRIGESVATLNPSTHQLEYHPVQGTLAKHFDGEMIRISGRGVAHTALDALVTPDHSMYVRQNGAWKFERADRLPSHGVSIKRTAFWQGEEPETYTIPAYVERHVHGRYKRYSSLLHPSITMPIEVWLRFLGIYLAAGSVGGHNRSQVSISHYSQIQEVQDLLNHFPVSVKRFRKGFQLSSIQLAHHLEPAPAFQKRVPAYIKTFCPRLIRIFLDAFRVGDGSVHTRTKQVSYYTTSKVLADDVQELLLKCGSLGNIRHRPLAGSPMRIKGQKTYRRRHNGYHISERAVKQDYHVDRRNVSRVAYSGYVYCVEVPHHILFVRRNGTPFWCGNCRFGYPALYAQMYSVEDAWGDVLASLADGRFRGFKTKPSPWFLCARVWIPMWPYGETQEKFKERRLFSRISPASLHHVVFSDVMAHHGLRTAGTDGELMTVTVEGDSIEEARGHLYRHLHEFYLYPMGWRSDLGVTLLDHLDDFIRWGYFVPQDR